MVYLRAYLITSKSMFNSKIQLGWEGHLPIVTY